MAFVGTNDFNAPEKNLIIELKVYNKYHLS